LKGELLVYYLFFYDILGLNYLDPLAAADDYGALVETLPVALILRLVKQYSLILALNS
jgi:hypothetical protein